MKTIHTRLSRHVLSVLGLSALVLLLVPVCSPAAPVPPSGREIMVAVDERPDGDDRISDLTMTLTNRRGRKRIRKVLSFRKDYGKDTKKLMQFKKPADVSGTAFLSWDYDNPETDDDRWLYMPALRNTRRISGKASDDYFMGTDFTYDDMGGRSVDEDTHTLAGEETIHGDPCWVVESVPVDPDDMYTKTVSWISREKKLPLKKEYHDKDGLLKVYTADSVEKIDGFWTVTVMRMENRVEDHKTRMEFSNIRFDNGLSDAKFRVNVLSRGARR